MGLEIVLMGGKGGGKKPPPSKPKEEDEEPTVSAVGEEADGEEDDAYEPATEEELDAVDRLCAALGIEPKDREEAAIALRDFFYCCGPGEEEELADGSGRFEV